MAAETSTSSAPLIVAYIALGGVLVSAAVNLIVGVFTNIAKFYDLKWKKEQWIKDKKESVYMKCLNASRILTIESIDGKIGIEESHFLGRMDSLRFATPWMTMVAAYSTGVSASQIRKSRDDLMECVKKVQTADMVLLDVDRHDGRQETVDAKLDQGLSVSLENAIKVVTECASSELMK